MSTPLRIYAYLDDEPAPSWFFTTDHGRTFERAYGDRVRVFPSSLIVIPHGHNDPEASRMFPRQQHARFQPHR